MSTTYEVRRSLAGADDWTVVATDLSEPAFRDSGLTVDTAYDYQVRACNAAGCSEWSASVTVTPIDIRYDVRQSLTGQNDWTVIATDLTDTEYLATGLAANTGYDFQVRACYLGVCSAWSAIATETTQEGPASATVVLRNGIIAGSRIAITAESTDERAVTARSGIVAGSRIAIKVDRQVAIRAGVIVGTRAQPIPFAEGAVELRSGIVAGTRIAIRVDVPVAIRAGVVVGTREAVQLYRTVRIRAGVIVGSRDGYVGPGTGIVAAGQRFSVNALREGDTFRVVLPWAGLQGMTGLAHVNSRTLRDDRTEQGLNLHISPLDQPNIPALAGGARPVAGADQQDYARRLSRSERTQDRIERDRR